MKDGELQILMVEDDRLDAKAAQRALAQSDVACEVTIAMSPVEAKADLAQSSFDLAILDYNLGAGTGLDVLEILEGLPAIMLTGSGNEDVAVQAMRKGAYDYVIKDGSGNHPCRSLFRSAASAGRCVAMTGICRSSRSISRNIPRRKSPTDIAVAARPSSRRNWKG